jgi:CubicO group peptidase (beta-lactamase class C family)
MTLQPSTAAALSRRLAVEQSTQRLPSVVAGVVRDGELTWSGTAGTLDGRAGGSAPSPDTQYRIGSISKTFVAVEVMRLRDAGLLDVADTCPRCPSDTSPSPSC